MKGYRQCSSVALGQWAFVRGRGEVTHAEHGGHQLRLIERTSVRSQVEKYRPSKIEDICGNDDAMSRLKVIAEDGNMPHLIFAVCGLSLLLPSPPTPCQTATGCRRQLP